MSEMDHDLECEEAYLRGEKDRQDKEPMKTIDVPAKVEPQRALTVRDAVAAVEKAPEAKAKTHQEMRVLEVSEALLPAYQKASTLELSDTEVEQLMAPFPDEVVEVRPHDGLLYIPHIHVSDRLNRIFRPGKWALVRRREWFDADSSTMFGEYVLVIRGCYVGESVGGHPYVKSNPKVNFSDVLESTAAEALRRICGKRLSLGSQVWNPEYCRQWEAKYRIHERGKYGKRSGAAPQAPAPAAPKPQAPPAAAPPQSQGEQTFPVVQVLLVAEKSGKAATTGKPWRAWFCKFSDGFGEFEAGTFSESIASVANDLSNSGENGRLVTKPGKKPGTREIVSLEHSQAPQPASDDQVPMEYEPQDVNP